MTAHVIHALTLGLLHLERELDGDDHDHHHWTMERPQAVELDTGDRFVRLPYVGQGHYDPLTGLAWDWWADLKPGDA